MFPPMSPLSERVRSRNENAQITAQARANHRGSFPVAQWFKSLGFNRSKTTHSATEQPHYSTERVPTSR